MIFITTINNSCTLVESGSSYLNGGATQVAPNLGLRGFFDPLKNTYGVQDAEGRWVISPKCPVANISVNGEIFASPETLMVALDGIFFLTKNGGGAVALIVNSADGTIQQNGPSVYNDLTKTITANLSATAAGEGGFRQLNFTQAVNILAQSSANFLLTWSIPFSSADYSVFLSASCQSDYPIIIQPVYGSFTNTKIAAKITNLSPYTIERVTINALAKLN